MLDVIFLLAGLFLLFGFVKACTKSHKPIRKAIVSMLCGVVALIAVSFITGLLGETVAVNIYTVFISLALGVPGVVLIIMKIFFI